jgi:hypothetical protein
MIRFTIRDVLWLMVVVGLGVGWWLDNRAAESRLMEAVTSVASRWHDEVGHTVRFSFKGIRGTHSISFGWPEIGVPSPTPPVSN